MGHRILILFSDTGGGHRAAANAIREALGFEFPGRFHIEMVDGIVQGALFPFNHVPKTYYPMTTYTPWFWGLLFRMSNSRLMRPLAIVLDDLVTRRGMARILRAHNPDLVITVHPLLAHTPCRILKARKPGAPFVTVVTDLFDAHSMWFADNADLLITPTEGAFARGLFWKFPRAKMRVVGQPISLKFALAAWSGEDIKTLRADLGLKPDAFTILLVGGGEGMGPLREIARALDALNTRGGPRIQLAIIAGRNAALRKRLCRERWRVPVNVQGFVMNMPDWLCASDLVITKAGPGTIMETLAAGRPMILSGNLPGQEEGNVVFVEQNGVGVLRTTPQAIAAQVRAWLTPGNTELQRMGEKARCSARPDAAREIAHLIAGML